MDMSSSTTSSTAPASAPQNHQRQEAMVSSPIIKEEARSPKEAHATQQASGGGDRKLRPQLPEALRCPRCNSNNTKFCYYNNYSTTQPRYFCKACRRYWTHGGTLRNVPVGGGCRKNKCTSGSGSASGTSSSSSSYAQLSPGINTSSSKMSINTQLMMVPNMTMPATTTTCLFPNVLPTLMSTGGGNDFDFTMDNQQVSLPFTPMPLSNQASVPALTAGGSGTTPSFLEMLRRGFLHGSNSYDTGLAMSDDNNGMDMSFPLPSYGTMHGHGLSGPTTDDARQLVGTQEGVNTDGGFEGSAGVQQQQEEEEEGDTKAMVKSSNSNNGGSLLDRYWTKPNNNDSGSNKGQQW